jgi:hypothetical protein
MNNSLKFNMIDMTSMVIRVGLLLTLDVRPFVMLIYFLVLTGKYSTDETICYIYGICEVVCTLICIVNICMYTDNYYKTKVMFGKYQWYFLFITYATMIVNFVSWNNECDTHHWSTFVQVGYWFYITHIAVLMFRGVLYIVAKWFHDTVPPEPKDGTQYEQL